MIRSSIVTKYIILSSKGENDIINITSNVEKILLECKLKNGIITLFVIGSTAAITTIEYEPGLQQDFPNMLEKIAPKRIEYQHDNTWHDGNGHSHLKASLIGPSLTIPFINGQTSLGTWQQIVFVEMDTRSRERKIVVQIIGNN
ncbi:MAG TPA: secondary thiamine-phosphate synthase enzyme YjbQ [Nitrososphaeraceae archaeon]|jgi:secondary thiamine-phosphate synthase enzyme|nr:secondary thiamine-phosphate synthase enzyme YjbQ [Nitrososphaeraceae archaeon]